MGSVMLRSASQRRLVDDRQLVPSVVPHQSRRRVYRQGGTPDDEHVRVPDGGNRTHHHVLLQPLLVENHVRLDDSATGAPGYALAALNRFHTVERAAPGTVVAPDAAMELQDIFAARLLVEAVDILGDDRLQLPLPLPLRKLPVGGIGLCVQTEHLVAVEAEKFLRVCLIEAVTENGFRGIIVLLMIEAAGAAEVGDTAFCADPGPAKKDNVPALINPFL